MLDANCKLHVGSATCDGRGVSGATTAFYCSFAPDGFVFTNDAATQSALIRSAPLQNVG